MKSTIAHVFVSKEAKKGTTMYTVSELTELGTAEDLILATKVQSEEDDISLPSDFPSEQFDE